jgi:hypothetical protein
MHAGSRQRDDLTAFLPALTDEESLESVDATEVMLSKASFICR